MKRIYYLVSTIITKTNGMHMYVEQKIKDRAWEELNLRLSSAAEEVPYSSSID